MVRSDGARRWVLDLKMMPLLLPDFDLGHWKMLLDGFATPDLDGRPDEQADDCYNRDLSNFGLPPNIIACTVEIGCHYCRTMEEG
ncbi:hypothetical protein ACLOJK_023093 [Asimina triloba]